MKGFLLVIGAICFSAAPVPADLTVGQNYQISTVDVDGNTLSTAGGHFTTVVLCSKANIDKARLVGDRSPDFCLGNPAYRMITVISFETKHSAPMRAVLKSVIRHRLDSEGRRLQTRYDQLKMRAIRGTTFSQSPISMERSRSNSVPSRPPTFSAYSFLAETRN